MRKKKWLWLAGLPIALLLLGYGLLVVVGLWRGEHFYAGRPTSYWRTTVKLWKSDGVTRTFEQMNALGVARRVNRSMAPGVLGGSRAAVLVLYDLRQDPDQRVRWAALVGLVRVSPKDEAAVAALEQALADEDEQTRRFAAFGLVEDVGASPAVCAAVCRALNGRDRERQRPMLEFLLVSERPVPAEIIGALRRAHNDEDFLVRVLAAEVLKGIDSEAAKQAGVK
jgi:HEAT repeats